MRKKFLTLLLAATLAATSTVPVMSDPVSAVAATKKTTKKTTKKLTAKQAKLKADKKAAAKVADLIDKIYVQDNEKAGVTDKDLKKAKLEWDKLTSAQKKLVSGTYASPEYFGRDTGDASEDNPLNWNYIGENEILVVSFGTSFNESRTEDIGGVERAIEKAYQNKGWSVRRAFTSQIIINHVQSRDSEKIDNVDQALERAVKNGVKNLVIQPTHLMHGKEYDELKEEVNAYKDKFQSVTFSEPLLGEVGSDTTSVNADKETVAKEAVAQALADYKNGTYKTAAAAAASGTAIVFMGHGTSHTANITYAQMQSEMNDLGYNNVFIGTVEGIEVKTATAVFDPDCQSVIKKIKAAGYKNVILRPLMVVAGDHANNDMAGDDSDSWKSQFAKVFGKNNVTCEIAGLGR
ncbi:MAG: sirohydrochlorin cobaltochelatase, partial [Candidatus Weimeria sp.]